MTGDISAIVLAAGKGTRMRSSLPKVLHPVAGKPMLRWVIDALSAAGVRQGALVLSPENESFDFIIKELKGWTTTVQEARQGTGDAVAAASFAFAGVTPPSYARGYKLHGERIQANDVLICAGDTPALQASELKSFVERCRAAKVELGVLGMQVPEPQGYGRCLEKSGSLLAIIEEKDATPEEKSIDVVNSGVYYARVPALFGALANINANNAQNEYYLTDCIKVLANDGKTILLHRALDWHAFLGVNDRAQLADLESWVMARKLRELQQAGATIRLPHTVYIEADVQCAPEAIIESGAWLGGDTRIASAAHIEANCRVVGSDIGVGARIGAGSYIKNKSIPAGAVIAPLSVVIG